MVERESEQFEKFQILSEELDLPYPMVEKMFQTQPRLCTSVLVL